MKEQFLERYNDVQREGADELLDWLFSSDFFTAPASTKYHLSCEGGLVAHSVNVYDRLVKLNESEGTGFSQETLAICGLLHDLCKVDFYEIEMKWAKDGNNKWYQYPNYVINDKLPYGHGERSVYVISGFMKLTREEAFAIRWHMGFSDDSAKSTGNYVSKVFGMYPLALMLSIADMQATYIDERTNPES